MRRHRFAQILIFSAASIALAGCAGFNHATTATTVTPTYASIKGVHGKVYGGQQPIGFAALQIYQVGGDYGTGATPLITVGTASAGYYAGGMSGCTNGSCYTGVVTDANGNFTLTNDYHCTTGTQVYMTATGGQPTPGTTNSAISLMLGLGLCDNLGPNTVLQVNEITTIGSVWALAPFMPATPATLPSTVGAPASNSTGLVNAFGDIPTLVNFAAGSPNSSSTTVTLPTQELYALANILANCVNSPGPTSTGCVGTSSDGLFNEAANADGSTPSDTLSAALNIARNPGRNVAALLAAQGGFPAFPSTFNGTDLTVSVTYSGSGISAPTGAAIDAAGNVWIANSASNSVTGFSHTGTVLTGANGFTAGSLNAPSSIAIDTTGNIWVANGGNNSTLSELSTGGNALFVSASGAGGLATPSSIAFDGLGNVWASNAGSNAVSEFSSTGSVLSGANGFTVAGVSAPVGIAINPR